jgi:hypothetical protein
MVRLQNVLTGLTAEYPWHQSILLPPRDFNLLLTFVDGASYLSNYNILTFLRKSAQTPPEAGLRLHCLESRLSRCQTIKARSASILRFNDYKMVTP